MRFPFLLEADPWYHFRLAESIVETGSRPEWDYLSNAPEGSPANYPPLLHYSLAYCFLFLRNLGFVVSLIQVSQIFPAIVGTMAVLVLYFLSLELFNSKAIALVSSFFFGIMPAFITRSLAGFTRPENLAFLLILISILYFLKSYKARPVFYSIISGLFLGLSGLTWVGWMFGIILIALLFFLKFLIEHNLSLRNFITVILVSATVVGPWILWSIKIGTSIFAAFLNPFQQQSIHHTIVMELQHPTLEIYFKMYGFLLFIFPFGLWYMLRKRSTENVFIVAWLLIGLYLSWTGIRFMFIPVPAISLAIGIFIEKALAHKQKLWKVIAPFAIGLLVFISSYNAFSFSLSATPMVNDEYYKALIWLRDNTPKNSITLAPWDQGYIIQAIAKRRTVLDGGSQFKNRTKEALEFFAKTNNEKISDFIQGYSIDYILIDKRSTTLLPIFQTWKEKTKFKKVFENDYASIYSTSSAK
ncbi:MAG: hypothetical protein HY929_04960 [Euryarchaeota archaeon]|nr:hypothetical protein [Euryarchaeota archaeon]